LHKWKQKREVRNRVWLQRILNSDYAKQWIKDREADSEFFYEKQSLKEVPEKQWKSDLLSDFFEDQDLEDIVKVLPEIWNDIKEQVKEELEYTVLDNPKTFEQHAGYSTYGYGYVKIDFSLAEHLGSIEEELQKILEKQLETKTPLKPEGTA